MVLTQILPVVLLFVTILIIEHFDKKKRIKELFKIKISERRKLERQYEELRFLYEKNLSPQEAYCKSIEYMEHIYGPMWWFGENDNYDKAEADKISCKIEEYLYFKRPEYLI